MSTVGGGNKRGSPVWGSAQTLVSSACARKMITKLKHMAASDTRTLNYSLVPAPLYEAAPSQSHFQPLLSHTPPRTTPSPLSSSLLIGHRHGDHNDTRISRWGCGARRGRKGRLVARFKEVNLFHFPKTTAASCIWDWRSSLLHSSERKHLLGRPWNVVFVAVWAVAFVISYKSVKRKPRGFSKHGSAFTGPQMEKQSVPRQHNKQCSAAPCWL